MSPSSPSTSRLRDADGRRIELSRFSASRQSPSIFVTHDQRKPLTLSDRIAVFNEGRARQIGTPARSTSTQAPPFVRSLPRPVEPQSPRNSLSNRRVRSLPQACAPNECASLRPTRPSAQRRQRGWRHRRRDRCNNRAPPPANIVETDFGLRPHRRTHNDQRPRHTSSSTRGDAVSSPSGTPSTPPSCLKLILDQLHHHSEQGEQP